MLIPLSYAAILGGTLTLVGTSTNLLVNSIYSANPNVEPMGMFEFTRYGAILMSIGLLYILFIAPQLLPSRTVTSSLTKSYRLGGYLTEMKITAESPLVGTTCLDRGINKHYDVMVLDILRDEKMITSNIRQTSLEAGDILFVRGTLDNFLRMKEVEKITLLTDEKLTQQELEKENNVLVECLLTEKSDLVGHSLMNSNFRRRFALSPRWQRPGEPWPLRPGLPHPASHRLWRRDVRHGCERRRQRLRRESRQPRRPRPHLDGA